MAKPPELNLHPLQCGKCEGQFALDPVRLVTLRNDGKPIACPYCYEELAAGQAHSLAGEDRERMRRLLERNLERLHPVIRRGASIPQVADSLSKQVRVQQVEGLAPALHFYMDYFHLVVPVAAPSPDGSLYRLRARLGSGVISPDWVVKTTPES